VKVAPGVVSTSKGDSTAGRCKIGGEKTFNLDRKEGKGRGKPRYITGVGRVGRIANYAYLGRHWWGNREIQRNPEEKGGGYVGLSA